MSSPHCILVVRRGERVSRDFLLSFGFFDSGVSSSRQVWSVFCSRTVSDKPNEFSGENSALRTYSFYSFDVMSSQAKHLKWAPVLTSVFCFVFLQTAIP